MIAVDTFPSMFGPPPRPGSFLYTGFTDWPPVVRRQGLGFAAAGAAGAAATGGTIAATLATAGLLAAPMALQLFLGRKGPGQKRTTSMIANEAERLLVDNLTLFNRGEISRATALQNFETIWGWLFQNCSAQEMGEPGQRCVNERGPGGVYDYFARYKKPIMDAADAAPMPPDTAGAGFSIPSPGAVFSGDVGLAPEIGWAMIAGLLVLGATL